MAEEAVFARTVVARARWTAMVTADVTVLI